MVIFVNKTLISLIFRPVNQSVINKAGATLESYASWG
jgi:hypothetical protein